MKLKKIDILLAERRRVFVDACHCMALSIWSALCFGEARRKAEAAKFELACLKADAKKREVSK